MNFAVAALSKSQLYGCRGFLVRRGLPATDILQGSGAAMGLSSRTLPLLLNRHDGSRSRCPGCVEPGNNEDPRHLSHRIATRTVFSKDAPWTTYTRAQCFIVRPQLQARLPRGSCLLVLRLLGPGHSSEPEHGDTPFKARLDV